MGRIGGYSKMLTKKAKLEQSRQVQATIFVKMPRDGGRYFDYFALDIPTYQEPERYDWLYITAWPLPSFGMPIGSAGTEWPDGLQVVRKAKELQKCQDWYQRAQDRIPRMKFAVHENSDGTLTVSNSVNGMSGQVHTHTPEDFADWKRNALETGAYESDFVYV